MLIHQSVVGGIIGKSGSKVKEIRDNSGTQVKVRLNKIDEKLNQGEIFRKKLKKFEEMGRN